MLAARLNLTALLLHLTEDYFGLQAQGSLIERCRRLRRLGPISTGKICKMESLIAFRSGLADWIAEEASLRMLHMRWKVLSR